MITGLATFLKNEPPCISVSEKFLESNDFQHPRVDIYASEAIWGAKPVPETRF